MFVFFGYVILIFALSAISVFTIIALALKFNMMKFTPSIEQEIKRTGAFKYLAKEIIKDLRKGK